MQSFPIIPADRSSIAMRRSVCGFGINDADYVINPIVNGKKMRCPFYIKWQTMIYKAQLPDGEIKVCDNWRLFSVFREWMSTKDWRNNDLSRIVFNPDNLVYSPNNCAFVSRQTLNFLNANSGSRGKCLEGVVRRKGCSKYHAQTSNVFSGSLEFLGSYDTEAEAHKVWKARKHELALQLAEQQADERVANALRVRFA